MYEQAVKSIDQGLSLGARIALGSIAAVFGLVMILIASPETGSKAIFFYGFGAFCLSIAIACFTTGRVRQFVGSTIGCIIFLTGVWYLASEVYAGALWSSRRSDPSAYTAVLYLLFIGLPGLSYAYRARFGFPKSP